MIKYKVIESTEGSPLHHEWERLRKACRASIFTSFDWSIEWLRHFDSVARPKVIR